MLFIWPSKETLSEAVLKCSSEKNFIKLYNKFRKMSMSCGRIILDKVAWKTEFKTVSELFCVEDSKNNHEQKQTSYIKKNCQLC